MLRTDTVSVQGFSNLAFSSEGRLSGASRLQTSVWRRLKKGTITLAVVAACLAQGPEATDAQAAPVTDAATQTLRYQILMEGRPIGQEVVTIHQQGDEATVKVATQTDVSILFLSFHYDHQRSEEWRQGQLVRMSTHTNDDGTKTDTVAERLQSPPVQDGQPRAGTAGWRMTVNGTVSERTMDSLPLTLWTSAVIRKDHLFSVIDAAPYAVQVAALGAEPLAIGSRTAEAQHYSMTGDVDRELWYDSDGHLLRTTFKRRGYPIEIVRQFE